MAEIKVSKIERVSCHRVISDPHPGPSHLLNCLSADLPQEETIYRVWVRDRKGTPKNFRDKDFAELSGKLSGEICLKTLVLLDSALELFRKFFGTVRVIFWLWGSFLALDWGG